MTNPDLKKRSFPLHWKVSLLVGGMLALLAIATGVSNYLYFKSVLHNEARARGKAISATLASALVEMPDSAIASTIHAVKKEANLAYVDVVGPNGALIAHTFEGRVEQGHVPSVARLILCAPDIDACHSAGRQPAGNRRQYCASAAPHVEHPFVAAQMKVIQNSVPLEKLAAPGRV